MKNFCIHIYSKILINNCHFRSIVPKLKIYVRRDNKPVFNAILLSNLNTIELVQKLSTVVGIPTDQVRDTYMIGPQGIHILLNNDLLKCLKDESMFQVEVLPENGVYFFLLKPVVKQ